MKSFFYFKEIRNRFLILFFGFFFNFFIVLYNKNLLLAFMVNFQERCFEDFMCTNITEIFFAFFKLGFSLGFYFLYPLLLIQFMLFLMPALYSYELKKLKFVIINSLILYCLSTFLTFHVFIPAFMNFLSEIQFQGEIEDAEVGYKIELGLKKYIDLFIQLLYGLLLVFHCFFLFIYCLWKLNLKLLINYRKIIYTFNLILATLFSPPDLGSQFLLAILFVLFFEIFLIFTFISKEYKKIKP